MNKISRFFFIILTLIFSIHFIGCNNKSSNRTINTKKQDDGVKTVEGFIFNGFPVYNVYIENSASMDGYVKGVTEFEQTVYNYLSDIKIMECTDTINLFYINSKPIPYGSDIADFIEKLEPTTFRNRGGDRGTTDIYNIIKSVLEQTTSNKVGILISDFIFSPGKNKDAEQYLINQQIGIKNIFAEYLAKYPDNAVIFYQLDSQFDGTYYDKNDKPYNYKGKRPYYIMVTGHVDYLKYLSHYCKPKIFNRQGTINEFTLQTSTEEIDYAIQYGTGNFKPDKRDPRTSIIEATKGKKGSNYIFSFDVNADFSPFLCNDAYIQNMRNYTSNDTTYGLKIEKYKGIDGKYTHTLRLMTKHVKPTTLELYLMSLMPQWIDEMNTDDGVGIHEGNADKTYGLKYLVYGIYDAFNMKSMYLTKITLNINK